LSVLCTLYSIVLGLHSGVHDECCFVQADAM